ncbi:CapA family protein [Actinobacteria bacterium YIM 96077]|uniref:Capsule synthesis protein CapA domain-containing protein n=1 Tax=Phytoactinopolyspora halophila TaxID=1981511 RepID=A0A329QK41_9ACTN|nr:CapA family protein [Phytoactinopolyspora halophila]AYY12383.1 CapA family protein [Actinobacteria bacterium YIM 96077]RAW12059.1 hypothetical protein DPM12_15325 [Phytoactinopolyspora halophila]
MSEQVDKNAADGVTTNVELFLSGDVMLGRGVDQILPHPGDPELREHHVKDARTYVELAESMNGPIPRPVDPSWPWGDAVPTLDELAPDVRIVNVETSITRSPTFDPGKAVHYRMSPDNIASLRVAAPDACVLANNHVMDFGPDGLDETLDVLERAGLRGIGAGRDEDGARRPAVIDIGHGGRVVVLGLGSVSSGIPTDWAAGPRRRGVDLVDLTPEGAASLAARIADVTRPGDIVVASIHWGSNWGYDIPRAQRSFAHQLIDEAGVDVVHGHSSHHARPIEMYRGKLILYGCGDLINDYEGISGGERYRDDLRAMYLASVRPESGELARLRIVPMRTRTMRLERAPDADVTWLASTLSTVSEPFGVRVVETADGLLNVAPETR